MVQNETIRSLAARRLRIGARAFFYEVGYEADRDEADDEC